jgi:hypothetical protein
MGAVFKEHVLFRPLGDRIAVYICLEDVETNLFAVHQLEFLDSASDYHRLEENKLALMKEMSPRQRCEWVSSLYLAIRLHDEEFGNRWESPSGR